MRARPQKIIVGGGWSGVSSVVGVCLDFLDGLDGLDFLDDFAGSGGARRRCVIDEGGLQRR